MVWEAADDAVRLNTARVASVVVVLTGLLFYSVVSTDPLELFLSAMALSAATAFPVIMLSIWWKRLSVAGTLLSLLVGFFLVVTLQLGSAGQVINVATPVAGFIGAIAAFATAHVSMKSQLVCS